MAFNPTGENGIVIDSEFQDLIPPLSGEELKALEEDIVANGCIVPLIVWPQSDGKYILIDGHNRYRICREHGIGFKANTRDFSSRAEAMLQIITLQLGRRNLTPFARTELAEKYRGIISGQAKQNMSDGGKKSRANEAALKEKQQSKKPAIESEANNAEAAQISGNLENTHEEGAAQQQEIQDCAVRDMEIPVHDKYPIESIRTAEKIGELAGVSRDTVEKARKISEKAADTTKDLLRKGSVSINQAEKIMRLPDGEREDAEGRLAAGEDARTVIKDTVKARADDVLTPGEYIDSARAVMGEIDLDPASSESANELICATVYFTKEDDGLSRNWNGRVWLSPPRTLVQKDFVEKLLKEYQEGSVTQACCMVDAQVSEVWFHTMMQSAACVLFVEGLVKCENVVGQQVSRLKSQAIAYFGENEETFKREFGQYGTCVSAVW